MEPLYFVGGSQLLLALFGDFLQLLPFFVEIVDLHLNLFRGLRLAHGQELLRYDVQLLQARLVSLQILGLVRERKIGERKGRDVKS